MALECEDLFGLELRLVGVEGCPTAQVAEQIVSEYIKKKGIEGKVTDNTRRGYVNATKDVIWWVEVRGRHLGLGLRRSFTL